MTQGKFITTGDSTPRSPPEQQVILISKFAFKAESERELSIEPDEALKLIERKGNGWILVKPIGRLGEPGLVPSSYVKIVEMAKNNLNGNIIDDAWLASIDQALITSETKKSGERLQASLHSEKESLKSGTPFLDSESLLSKEGNSTKSLNSPISFESEQHFSFQSTNPMSPDSSFHIDDVHPVSGLVKNAACHNGRYWYRVDICMSDGRKKYLCRYYQDFYKLHCSIMDKLRSSLETEVNIQKFPALPDPIPRPDLQTLSSILLQRCQVLNVYIFKVVQNKHKLDYSKILNEWIQPRLGDIEVSAKESLSSEQIEKLLQPLPTNVSNSHPSSTSSNQIKITSSPTEESIPKPIPTTSEAPSPTIPKRAISRVPLTRARPSLSISTSVTPPLPAPSSQYMRTRSSSNLSSSHIGSPMVWQSPTLPQAPTGRSERSASLPHTHTLQNARRPSYTTNFATAPLNENAGHSSTTAQKHDSFVPGNFRVTSRKGSVATTVVSSPLRSSLEFVKIKVSANEDIFALKVQRDATLDTIKQSILTRLECDIDHSFVKLYYKHEERNQFVPLVADIELADAFNQQKVLFKVHLFFKDARVI